MQRVATSLVPDTPTPFNSQNSSGYQGTVPTSLRPLRSRDAMASIRAASSTLPASPGLKGINVDVSMESDRRTGEHDQRYAGHGGAFDENSPRYGSAPVRSTFVRKPSNLRAHISEDSEESEDDGGSLRIRMSQQNPAARDSTKHAQALRSPSVSAMSSPQRPAYRSITHDSPVSGFDGMARELRREFERITNAQQHQSTIPSVLSSPALASKGSNLDRSTHLGRRVFADVSNQSASPDRAPSYKGYSYAAEPQKQQLRSSPKPTHIDRFGQDDDHIFRSNASPKQQTQTYAMPDVTGITEGLASPEKAMGYRKLATPDRRSNVSNNSLKNALGDLEAKLNALESENSKSTRRIQQLEAELHHQKDFPNAFQRHREHDSALGTASSERPSRTHIDMSAFPDLPHHKAGSGVLEDLVERLHAHVARLTKSLNTHSHALEDLKSDMAPQSEVDLLRRQMSSYDDQVAVLRSSIATLSREVAEVRQLVEGLASEKPRTFHTLQSHDVAPRASVRSVKSEGAQPRQRPLSAYYEHRPASAPPQQRNYGKEQMVDPELQRAEAILRSMPPPSQPTDASCSMCQHQPKHRHAPGSRSYEYPKSKMQRPSPADLRADMYGEDEGFVEYGADEAALPPQALLSRALRELENDFATHKDIYIELSEAYKKIDPASNASKRRALASHLKESVDSLESKADEIRRMYDMLHYAESSGAKATFHAR